MLYQIRMNILTLSLKNKIADIVSVYYPFHEQCHCIVGNVEKMQKMHLALVLEYYIMHIMQMRSIV